MFSTATAPRSGSATESPSSVSTWAMEYTWASTRVCTSAVGRHPVLAKAHTRAKPGMASRCRWVTTRCFDLKLTVIYAAKRPCLAPPGRPRCGCYATPDAERREPRHPAHGCTSLRAPRRQVRPRRSQTGSGTGPAILCSALHWYLPCARVWPAGVGGKPHGPGFTNRQGVSQSPSS